MLKLKAERPTNKQHMHEAAVKSLAKLLEAAFRISTGARLQSTIDAKDFFLSVKKNPHIHS